MPSSDQLSDFELYVMLAVAGLGDDAYGVTIATRISERTDRDISIGAVYATLGRLSDKGYVSFSYSDPEPVRGGRARKLVALTPAGVRALNRTTTALHRMLDGVALRPATGDRR
jgi:DNA-binding PadR family transcriptional regulator